MAVFCVVHYVHPSIPAIEYATYTCIIVYTTNARDRVMIYVVCSLCSLVSGSGALRWGLLGEVYNTIHTWIHVPCTHKHTDSLTHIWLHLMRYSLDYHSNVCTRTRQCERQSNVPNPPAHHIFNDAFIACIETSDEARPCYRCTE